MFCVFKFPLVPSSLPKHAGMDCVYIESCDELVSHLGSILTLHPVLSTSGYTLDGLYFYQSVKHVCNLEHTALCSFINSYCLQQLPFAWFRCFVVHRHNHFYSYVLYCKGSSLSLIVRSHAVNRREKQIKIIAVLAPPQ